jgi:hypothetical protein
MTADNRYVPFVVITILSFPHSYLSPVYNTSNTTGATSGIGTACTFGAPEFIPIQSQSKISQYLPSRHCYSGHFSGV